MIASILLIAALSAVPVDLAEYTWSAPIERPVPGGGFVKVELTPEMMARSKQDLSDVRIIDEKNLMAPFVIQSSRPKNVERITWRNATPINYVYEENASTQVTLDFKEQIRKSILKMDLSGANFRRRVVVEASPDNLNWQRLGQDFYVFRVPAPEKDVVVDTINLPENDFRYLRLTVHHMPDDPSRIEIRNVGVALREQLPARPPQPINEIEMTDPIRDPKIPYTAYEVDMKHVNMPVESVEVKITDPYFYIPYEILGRNSRSQRVPIRTETGEDLVERETPWQPLDRGVFFRIQGPEKTTENLAAHLAANYRYLQLRFFEKDNPPVTLESLRAYRWQVFLAFDWKSEGGYHLIGGKENAVKPEFTLAQAVTDLGEMELPVAQTGTITLREPAEPKVPWTQKYQTLIWAALFTVVSLMVLLILINMPKIKAQDHQ